jgi:hypothetical protein
MAAAGAGAVQGNTNILQSFLAGVGGGANARSKAEEAAREYAMKQAQMEEAAQQRQVQQDYIRALTERAKKKTKLQIAEETLGRPLTDVERAKVAGTYIAPQKAKTPKEPKPLKITRHGFTQTHTEQDYLNDIGRDMSLMKPDEAAKFQSWLVSVYTGRAAGDSETLRRAAGSRLRQIQAEGR